MELFTLSIITPRELFFKEQVVSVIAPGSDGFLEILAHHAPLIVFLKSGKLTVTEIEGEKLIFAISSGFLEVAQNEVNIVADAIESIQNIDEERAASALKRAVKRLESEEGHIDVERAKRALLRAKNRLILKKQYEESDRNR